jgi:hypothetical protein
MRNRGLVPWACALIVAALTWSGTASAADAADLPQLQHEWWQWVMAIPSSDSPVYDKTGNRCGIAQRGDVWFLAGSTGGKVTRKCTVPAGVKLLVPVVNNFCFPDAAYTDEKCTTDSIKFIDDFDPAMISLVIGIESQDIERVSDTDNFDFTVGYNGFGGVKPGVYRATVADGYWGLLGPLDPGAYTVHIVAQGPLNIDVTYHLDVVGPANRDSVVE